MSKYTITVKQLIEMKYHLKLDAYPIFDEAYRNTLNKKIIDHYYFQEIGFETPDRFNHYLELKMSEIMPYYNQLYKSELLNIDPLNDFETTTIKNTTGNEQDNVTQEGSKDGTETNIKTGKQNSTSMQTNGGKDSEKTDLTIDKTSTRNGNTTNNGTTTNDLQTESNTHSTGSGTNNTKGNKNTIFSDTPPNQITTITNPDGSITTTSYATTTTNDTTTENATTSTSENSNGTVTNTGTVKNVNSTDETLNGTEKDIHSESKDTTYGKTIDETLSSTNNENLEGTKKETSVNSESANKNYSETNDTTYKGHTKSQAELLLKYRETFLNIDMMIIEELSSLFMQIY